MKIIGVSRGNLFSPNHINNDTAIFRTVTERLTKWGYEVVCYTEEEFLDKQITGDYIFSMARSYDALERLYMLEQAGSIVVNSSVGIRNCIRKPMTELLVKNRVSHPRSYILSTHAPFELNSFPYWIKRADSHAMVKTDVVYVRAKEEAERVLTDFRARGISEAVVNEHLIGDLIKFYGVNGTEFFYMFYPTIEQSHSKFGLEAINGKGKGFPFDKRALQRLATKASTVLNVPVYGGDCVISDVGEIQIIDFNDWPSFACCREEAATAIAQRILQQFAEKEK